MHNVYSPLKIFHFKEKIDSLSPENQAILPPIHIRIKPTNICNHNCRYCAYRAENLQLGRDMVKTDSILGEKMLEIVNDIIEMGVMAVTFSGGGEPLIYPYLSEVLKKLADSPVSFATLTNGSRLSGEISEIFAHHRGGQG
jgi:MoaA/NifB/PqqE/SkfB family radical SAM enzyme